LRKGKNYINGKWINCYSRKTFDDLNPATGKLFGKYQASNGKDVDRAVKTAGKALKSWKETP